MTKTLNLPEIETEITKPDGKKHFVRIKALLAGDPVVALCGKKFVPKLISGAEDLPGCAPCHELMRFLEMMEDV